MVMLVVLSFNYVVQSRSVSNFQFKSVDNAISMAILQHYFIFALFIFHNIRK